MYYKLHRLSYLFCNKILVWSCNNRHLRWLTVNEKLLFIKLWTISSSLLYKYKHMQGTQIAKPVVFRESSWLFGLAPNFHLPHIVESWSQSRIIMYVLRQLNNDNFAYILFLVVRIASIEWIFQFHIIELIFSIQPWTNSLAAISVLDVWSEDLCSYVYSLCIYIDPSQLC